MASATRAPEDDRDAAYRRGVRHGWLMAYVNIAAILAIWALLMHYRPFG